MLNAQRPTQKAKENEEQNSMLQMKEQDKSPKTDLNEMEVNDLPGRESKIMVLKMFTEVRKAMHEQNKNFNRYGKH